MEARGNAAVHQVVCETAFVFLTVFLLVNGLLDDDIKEKCRFAVTGFCMLRIVLGVLILLPEKIDQSLPIRKKRT